MSTAFQTHPSPLAELLKACQQGRIQLPDFQRSWVWDEERIRSLIASVSRDFPIGALMTLRTGGPVSFKPRPVEGAQQTARGASPEQLLLDGQQRITSLYQVTIRREVVRTITTKRQAVKRWFYLDIMRCLDSAADREEAVVIVPEDRVLRADFGRTVTLDLSSPEKEYAALMFPLTDVFDWDAWQDGFDSYWLAKEENDNRAFFRAFKRNVLEKFKAYQVPVIALDKDTSKEAVCTVFEKVNTGGKALDAFELVTAMYAAEGHELRKDWLGDDTEPGMQHRLRQALRAAESDEGSGILANVANTDVLQAISLFHTRDMREDAMRAGKSGKELPFVSGNRNSLLSLPLSAYKKYRERVESGFMRAAKFLHLLHIYRVWDLPYQSQLVPLAAILSEIGDDWEHQAVRQKLQQWYWCGVFGELYGSTVEGRIAKDFLEVPAWIKGGPEPTTVREAVFRSDRLKTMRGRLSAAYKGVNVLLMQAGALDWRSGQRFDHTVFFDENVDIHHIFPKDWCKSQGIPKSVYDSVVNKTPLAYRTNRIIGGAAPSRYLAQLEKGSSRDQPISASALDRFLTTHLVSPQLLRNDDFETFMQERTRSLLQIIGDAMGKKPYQTTAEEEAAEIEPEESEVEV